jgi:hypothetical protein
MPQAYISHRQTSVDMGSSVAYRLGGRDVRRSPHGVASREISTWPDSMVRALFRLAVHDEFVVGLRLEADLTLPQHVWQCTCTTAQNAHKSSRDSKTPLLDQFSARCRDHVVQDNISDGFLLHFAGDVRVYFPGSSPDIFSVCLYTALLQILLPAHKGDCLPTEHCQA